MIAIDRLPADILVSIKLTQLGVTRVEETCAQYNAEQS